MFSFTLIQHVQQNYTYKPTIHIIYGKTIIYNFPQYRKIRGLTVNQAGIIYNLNYDSPCFLSINLLYKLTF